jgi:S-adenosylmethionine-dependent methyltransferase
MPVNSEEFDRVIGEWKEWQSFPWSKLIYSTSHLNISRHIMDCPIKVLDIGGGNGSDAIYFAKQGHFVTCLDYSAAMLAEAKQTAEEQGVAGQITFCQADAGANQSLFGDQQFDLILCHLMLSFVPSVPQLLKSLHERLAPGGFLSLIGGNRYSEAYLKACQANDLGAALNAVGTQEHFYPWFNRALPMFSGEEIIDLLQEYGDTLAGHYGILCLCAYLPNEPKFEAGYFEALEQLEHKLTATYPYYLLARYFHVIVQTNT